MTDGLKDEHRRAIIAVLAANDRVKRAVLFGSRATGTHTVTSDVDIALFGDRLTLRDRARLAAVIDEIPMAQSVDLLLYNSIQDLTLREHVQRQGVEWYARRSPDDGYDPSPNRGYAGDWVSIQLGEACTKIGSGATPRGGKDVYLRNGPYALIRSQNVLNEGFRHEGLAYIGQQHASDLAGVEVQRGDVLLNITGDSVARVCQVDPSILPARVNQHVAIIRPDTARLDPRFLRYSLVDSTTQAKLLSWAASGGTRNALTKAMIEAIDVKAPTAVSEQHAIADVLGTLDDKIELNRRMNETLEAMARALFKSWFVDFDPVRAKMEGRHTGLPQDIAALFPDQLVDSEVGEIPKGWSAGTLADTALLNPESWSNRNTPDRIRYVDLANTKRGYIDDIRPYTWEDAPSRARRVLRSGDTIVGTVRPGNRSYALIDGDGLTSSTGFAVLRPTNATEREIVWCAATSDDAIERLAHLADGAAYPAVRPSAVLDTAVVLPEKRVRRVFSSLTAPSLDRMHRNQREAVTLAALRDTLLPGLISGEIRLSEADEAMGAEA